MTGVSWTGTVITVQDYVPKDGWPPSSPDLGCISIAYESIVSKNLFLTKSLSVNFLTNLFRTLQILFFCDIYQLIWIASQNPLDYTFWAYVQDRACPLAHANLESLKESITRAWMNMPEEYIKASCDAFPRRIKDVIAAQGGSIKKN